MVNDKFKTIQCLPYKNNDGDEEGKRWRVEAYFLLWLKNRILHFSWDTHLFNVLCYIIYIFSD